MALIDDYIRRIDDHELPALRRQLAPLEAGDMTIGSRRAGGDWVDITKDHIDHLKRSIATYEHILARYPGK